MRGWLEENTAGEEKRARCSVCDIGLRAQHGDLVKHARRALHKANMEKYNIRKQKRLDNIGIQVSASDAQKVIDLRLAVYIATHSAVRGIDHLTEILKDIGKGSSLEQLRLHRTKCSRLISQVLAPAMLTALVNDINESDNGFSLIIDESTDISVTKFLALVIKYHSKSKNKVVTEFLGFVEVYRATAKDLFGAITEYLTSVGLDYKKCIGLGVDGASALCGRHNSVFTLFRAEVPNIVLIRCVCHTIHGAASKACLNLPADLEFLVRESRNWFAKSPLKRNQYHDLYSAINRGALPQALVQLSTTRWLAWHRAIVAILNQWLELKAHFDMHMRSQNPAEKSTIGRKLHELYGNEAMRLYLLFLKPITAQLNAINTRFQATDDEVTTAFAELHEIILVIVRKVLKPECVPRLSPGECLQDGAQSCLREALRDPNNLLPLEKTVYGNDFAVHLGKIAIQPRILEEVKHRCRQYLVSLASHLLDILPDQADRLAALHAITPAESLQQVGRAQVAALPLSLADPAMDMDRLQFEWDALPLTDWKRFFGGEIPQSSIEFWEGVANYRLGGVGDRKFYTLASFALRILSLPFSNAVVERVFSIMNAIKTKARNRLSVIMLVSLVRIRLCVKRGNMCCQSFEPTEDMLSRFTQGIYATASDATADEFEGNDLDDALNLLAADE